MNWKLAAVGAFVAMVGVSLAVDPTMIRTEILTPLLAGSDLLAQGVFQTELGGMLHYTFDAANRTITFDQWSLLDSQLYPVSVFERVIFSRLPEVDIIQLPLDGLTLER